MIFTIQSKSHPHALSHTHIPSQLLGVEGCKVANYFGQQRAYVLIVQKEKKTRFCKIRGRYHARGRIEGKKEDKDQNEM